MGTGDLCRVSQVLGAPSSGTPRESQTKFRDELEKGPVGTRPTGSVFGKNSFCRETWGTRLRGSPCG